MKTCFPLSHARTHHTTFVSAFFARALGLLISGTLLVSMVHCAPAESDETGQHSGASTQLQLEEMVSSIIAEELCSTGIWLDSTGDCASLMASGLAFKVGTQQRLDPLLVWQKEERVEFMLRAFDRMKPEYQPSWLKSAYPQIINGDLSLHEVVEAHTPDLTSLLKALQPLIQELSAFPSLEALGQALSHLASRQDDADPSTVADGGGKATGTAKPQPQIALDGVVLLIFVAVVIVVVVALWEPLSQVAQQLAEALMDAAYQVSSISISGSGGTPGQVSCSGNDCEYVDRDGNTISVPKDGLADALIGELLQAIDELRHALNERNAMDEANPLREMWHEEINLLLQFIMALLQHLEAWKTMPKEIACQLAAIFSDVNAELGANYSDEHSEIKDIIEQIIHTLVALQQRCVGWE